jgi:hypothetical protein
VNLPAWLGGGPVPPIISNSTLFLLKPPNVSTGDFFERHFQVAPHYYGGKIRKEFGGGRWSGNDLGWKKYDFRANFPRTPERADINSDARGQQP